MSPNAGGATTTPRGSTKLRRKGLEHAAEHDNRVALSRDHNVWHPSREVNVRDMRKLKPVSSSSTSGSGRNLAQVITERCEHFVLEKGYRPHAAKP